MVCALRDGEVVCLPQSVDSVELVRKVGEGGMGVVFEGRNGPSGQPVAVKILHPRLAQSREMVARFHREAALLMTLNHPHVVKIIAHFRWGQNEALITEWLPGGNLKGMLEQMRHWRQQMPFSWGVQYLWQASCGLDALHKRGLVHRDVKPSNLLIGADGRLKVSDLGLARPLGREQSDLTQTGAFLGSVRYMAPEQLDDSSKVDDRADLYALGRTFYELLTGQLPQEAWLPPSRLNATVPVEFDAVIQRLLAREPGNRFADVAALQAALHRFSFRPGPSGSAAPVSTWQKMFAPAITGILGILGGFYLAAVLLLLVRPFGSPRAKPAPVEGVAQSAPTPPDSQPPPATSAPAPPNRTAAPKPAPVEGVSQSARTPPDSQPPPATSAPTPPNRTAAPTPAPAKGVAQSAPDQRPSLPPPRPASLRQMEQIPAVTSVRFSPDGRRVATGSDDKTARLWDAEKGNLLQTFQGHTDGVRSVAFSPDGRRVATGSDDKTARLWDAEKGNLLKTFQGHTDGVRSVAFSPDGRRVATGSADKTARLWDAETGNLLKDFQGHTDWVRSVAFSPDGRRVVTGSDDKTARLWDAETGNLLKTFQGHTDWVRSVAFSPDGRRVVTGSADKTARLWDAETGNLLKTFQGHASWIRSVAFSPDGRRVATGSADKTARLWDAETGNLLQTFLGHTDRVHSVAFSPDGRRVATGSLDGTCRLWDVETGQEVCQWWSLKTRSWWGFQTQRWVVLTADGWYDCDGSQMTHSLVRHYDQATGRELSPEESKTYFQPDLVRKALSGR